jgi:hypothetical protein
MPAITANLVSCAFVRVSRARPGKGSTFVEQVWGRSSIGLLCEATEQTVQFLNLQFAITGLPANF